MLELFRIALAVSVVSITISTAKIFEPVRNRTFGFLRTLLECPYCLSHWVALLAILLYRPSWWLPVDVFAVVALASMVSLVLLWFLDSAEVFHA